MKRFNLLKQRGISLLEVMLSLAIIAVILVMATRYFGIASRDAFLNKATQEVGEIRQGYSRYQLDHGNITGIALTDLYNQGYITQQTSMGNNPWGGKYTPNIAGAGADSTLTIDGIPAGACNSLAARFNETCNGGSVTVPLLQ